MPEYGLVAGHFAAMLPVFLVLIVGAILLVIRRDRLPGRARALALAGCGVLLVEVVLGFAWDLSLPSLVEKGDIRVGAVGPISIAASLLLYLLTAAGLALLVGSTLSRGVPAAGAGQPWPPTGSFATPAGQPMPHYGAPLQGGAPSSGAPTSPPASPGYPVPGAPTSGPGNPGYPAPGQATPPWAQQTPRG